MYQQTTYQGWSNRETWAMNVWLMNQPYSNEVLQHIVQSFETTHEQAEELEYWVRTEYRLDSLSTSVATDLLNIALSRIDWVEIIDNSRD